MLPKVFARIVSRISRKLLWVCIITLTSSTLAFAGYHNHVGHRSQPNSPVFKQEVLGTTSKPLDNLIGKVAFNIPAVFNENVTVNNKDLSLGIGNLTAANVIYSITPGKGLTSTGGQRPIISLDRNGIVTSFQGKTGDVSLTAGSGITINGTTISTSGVTSVGGSTGSVTLTAGSGISISGTTISNTGVTSLGGQTGSVSLTAGTNISISGTTISDTLASGLTTNGVLYANGSSSLTSLTPGTSGYVLQSNGSGSAPSWVANSATNPSFSTITTGSNSTATMTVASGASLTYSGGTASSGVINANQLLGNTWASPGTIGSGTAASGTFSTLTVNANSITLGGGNETLTQTSGKNVSFADAFTTSGANPLTLTTTAGTNVTVPTTGTLLTNTASANQTITSSQNTGTMFSLSDTTNIAGALTGASITLSGTGAFDQTGLSFNLSGASGTNLNDIVGSGSTWKISRTGVATFASLTSINSSGAVLVPNGSAAAPSYSFTNSTGTGLYLPSNNILGFATGGNERMRIDSSGNLAINTTSPLATLDVRANSYTTPVASISGSTGKAVLVVDQPNWSGDIFAASQSGQNRFVITNAGNIGVGTTTPLSNLAHNIGMEIVSPSSFGSGNGTATFGLLSKGSGGDLIQFGANNSYAGANGANISFDNNVLGALEFGTNGVTTDSMIITSGGSVGIGATSILANTGLQVKLNSLGNATEVVDNTGGAGDIFTASSAGAAKFVINSSGNVGIQTNNPSSFPLQVAGNVGPNTTDTYNLGSSSLEWNNIYAKNIISSGAGGSNGWWQLNAKVVSPVNSTYDLSIGNTGSSSATPFQVFALSGAQAAGTASESGALSFFGSANAHVLNILDNGSLNLQTSVGGDAAVNSALFVAAGTRTTAGNIGVQTTTPKNALDVNGSLAVGTYAGNNSSGQSNSLIVSGNVGIGVTNPSSFTLQAAGNAGPNATDTYNLGSSSLEWNTIYAKNVISSGSSGSNGFWQLNSSVLSPSNSFYDLGIGGTATSSALFQVFGATGNATSAGNLTFNSAGNIQTTKNQTFIIGGNTTGDIQFKPGNSASSLYLTSGGNVGVGTTTPGKLLEIAPPSNAQANLGLLSTGGAGDRIYFGQGGSYTNAGILEFNQSITNGFEFVMNNSTTQMAITQGGNIGIGPGNTSPLATLDVRANQYTTPVASFSGSTGKAVLVLDQPNWSGDIFTASQSGQSRFTLNNNGDIILSGTTRLTNAGAGTFTTVNGNTITTGTGTLTMSAGKTLTLSDSTTLATNVITFGGSETLTLAASQNVSFANSFTTSGAFALTLTQTAATNVTLPTTGTLLTNTASANQTITSTQNSGTLLNLTDSTNISAAITGLNITLSGTGAFNQTGLAFNLSGASGSNLYDVLGSGSNWSVTTGGVAKFANVISSASSGSNGFWQLNSKVLSPTNTTYDLAIGGTGSSSATPFQVFGLAGAQAAGTASESGALSFFGSSNAHVFNILDNGSLNFQTSVGGDATVNSALYIGAGSRTTAGNVGVGTTNPGATLDVAGTINASGLISANGGLTVASGQNFTLNNLTSGSIPYINSSKVLTQDNSNFFWDATNKRLGIGTGANPQAALQIGSGGTATPKSVFVSDYNNTPAGNINFGGNWNSSNTWGIGPAANGSSDNLLRIGVSNGAVPYNTWSGTQNLNLLVGGNVGIGNGASNTTPGSVLDVGTPTTLVSVGFHVGINSKGNATAVIDNTGGQGDLFTASSAGTTKFVIDKSGNIGVQTSTATITNGIRVGSSSVTGTPTFIYSSDISNGANGSASFVGNWQSSGAWGIGAATNSSTDNTLRIGNTVGSSVTWSATQNLNLLLDAPIGQSALAALDVRASGYTTPVASISGSTGKAVLVVDQPNWNGDIFAASQSGQNRFVITNQGNVGVGTTTPQYLFDVSGSGGELAYDAAVGSALRLRRNGANTITADQGGGTLSLQTGGANTRIYIDSTGNVGIGNAGTSSFPLQIKGNVGPDATDTYNLGSASLEWNNIYAKNVITTNSSGSNGFWQLNSKVLSPSNSTYDLSIGNTGSSSATPFQVFALAGTQAAGTASQSGAHTFFGSGNAHVLNILDNGSLNFQTSVGGDAQVNSALFIAAGTRTTAGNVGIGTTTPKNPLDVNGSVAIGSYAGVNSAGQSNSLIVSGNIGVGTTNPTSQLYVNGNFSLGVGAAVGGSIYSAAFQRSTGGLTIPDIYGDGADALVIAGKLNGTGTVAFGTGTSVGIGTNSPLATLDVRANGYTTPVASISGSTGMATLVVDQPNWTGDIFAASQSGQNRFVITNQGNIGIGTTGPNYALQISGNTKSFAQGPTNTNAVTYYLRTNSTNQLSTTNLNPGITVYDDSSNAWGMDLGYDSTSARYRTRVFAGGYGDIVLATHQTNNLPTSQSSFTDRLVVRGDSGKIGIGTDAPDSILSVKNGSSVNAVVNIYGLTGGANPDYGIIQVGSVGDLNNANSKRPLILQPNNGYVGIGASLVNPLATLDVRANGYTAPVASISGSTGVATLVVDQPNWTGDIFAASQSGQNRFVITNQGNVGIGTTTPGRTLDVTGNFGGNVVTDAQTNCSTTQTESTKSFEYYLSNNVTSGTLTCTFNITGTPNTEGSVVFISARAIASASQTSSVVVKINTSTTILSSFSATGTTNIKSIIAAYMNGAWRTLTGVSAADTNDLAEWIRATGRLPQAGELISTGDTTTVHLSSAEYDKKVAGIVTTNPNTVYGKQTDDSVAMALAGRIPAIVTSLNGDIHSGDTITSSPFAGVGMLPSQSAFTVGKALESFNPSSNSCQNISSYNAIQWPADDGTNQNHPCFAVPVSSFDQATQQTLIGEYGVTPSDVVYIGKIMVLANLSYSEVTSHTQTLLTSVPGLIRNAGANDVSSAQTLQLMANSRNLFGANGATSLFGDTVFAGTVIADKIKANQIEGLQVFTNQIGELSGSLATLANQVTQTSTNSSTLITTVGQITSNISALQTKVASFSSQLSKIDDLSKQVADLQKLVLGNSQQAIGTSSGQFDKLTVLGKTLLSDVGITGKVTMGLLSIDGMGDDIASPAAAINTLSGPLQLQSLALGGIDILNGKVTIDTNGNLKVNATITAKKYNVDTSDILSASVGETIIPAGSTSATIKTSALTNVSKIFATPKKLPIPVSTNLINADTFEIDIQATQLQDLPVDWWIVN